MNDKFTKLADKIKSKIIKVGSRYIYYPKDKYEAMNARSLEFAWDYINKYYWTDDINVAANIDPSILRESPETQEEKKLTHGQLDTIRKVLSELTAITDAERYNHTGKGFSRFTKEHYGKAIKELLATSFFDQNCGKIAMKILEPYRNTQIDRLATKIIWG